MDFTPFVALNKGYLTRVVWKFMDRVALSKMQYRGEGGFNVKSLISWRMKLFTKLQIHKESNYKTNGGSLVSNGSNIIEKMWIYLPK